MNQDLLHSFKRFTLDEKLCVYTNSVYLDYDIIGTLKYIPLDFFNHALLITNILSLEDNTEKFRITMYIYT